MHSLLALHHVIIRNYTYYYLSLSNVILSDHNYGSCYNIYYFAKQVNRIIKTAQLHACNEPSFAMNDGLALDEHAQSAALITCLPRLGNNIDA